jgi:hypothetical protein
MAPFIFQIVGVNQNGQDLHSLHLKTDELHMLCMTLVPYVQFRAAQCASKLIRVTGKGI